MTSKVAGRRLMVWKASIISIITPEMYVVKIISSIWLKWLSFFLSDTSVHAGLRVAFVAAGFMLCAPATQATGAAHLDLFNHH